MVIDRKLLTFECTCLRSACCICGKNLGAPWFVWPLFTVTECILTANM